MQLLGIVNVTRDSFSDGGQFLDPEFALAHARRLVADGADWIDIGAEATNPKAEAVPAETEIARLTPVVRALLREGIRVSVDTHKPAVIRAMLALGVEMINDVTALRDPESVAALRDSAARIILMHSTAVAGARAELHDVPPDTIIRRIRTFFETRIAELAAAGIARERLFLDPGMGLFLAPDPAVSLAVLRNLGPLAELGLPLCVSTSRKSFVGSILNGNAAPRPVGERAAGTLATELWAAQAGAAYIRTHDVRAVRDAWTVWTAIAGVESTG